MKQRVGIMGYGNLGRGVALALQKTPDLALAAVFTRRDPASVSPVGGAVCLPVQEAATWQDRLDVLILCGGSATDLPTQTVQYAAQFHVVDSFDTHARIPEHFAAVDKTARDTGHVALISAGWDPGLFSLNRLYANAVLPHGSDYTFWGRGVSQGHSDAIRRIPGVRDAKQYTVPVESALEAVRQGRHPHLTTRQKHLRECFVALEDGADPAAVEQAIKTMPNYFADYDTTVHFISLEELRTQHSGMAHGGMVFRSGTTGAQEEHTHIIEYRLTLDSNPEFTGSVLAACARAVCRLAARNDVGCHTLFDVPPALLHPLTGEELRRTLL